MNYECSVCGRTTLTGLTLRPSGKTFDRHTDTPEGGEVCKGGSPVELPEEAQIAAVTKRAGSKESCKECGEVHPALRTQKKVRKHTNPYTLDICQQREHVEEECVTCKRPNITMRMGKYVQHKDFGRNTRCTASNKTVKEALAVKHEAIPRPKSTTKEKAPASEYKSLSGIARSHLKAKRLAETVKPHGWKASYEEDQDSGAVTLVLTRGTGGNQEMMQISWFNGACIGGDGKITHSYKGRIIAVRNASAVKQRAALTPAQIAEEYGRVATRKAAPRSRTTKTAEQLKELLPFDPEKANDSEILRAITGRNITWENKLSGKRVTGVAKSPKIVKGKNGRQITFTGPTGTSTVRIESIVSVG